MSDAMKNMSPVFDYGKITDEQKKAAEEICLLLQTLGQPLLSDLIKEKFGIVQTPKYNIDEHEFVKACMQAELHCAIQGFVKDGTGNIEYPVIAICDDSRKFFNLYNIIKNS